MLIGRDGIINDVITLGLCCHVFFNVFFTSFCACLCFTLIGRNLTAQSMGSHRGIEGRIQDPEK